MSALEELATSFWTMEEACDACIELLPAAASETDMTDAEQGELLEALEKLKKGMASLHRRGNEILEGHGVSIPESGGGTKGGGG